MPALRLRAMMALDYGRVGVIASEGKLTMGPVSWGESTGRASRRRESRPRGDTLLAKCALALAVPAVVLSGIQLAELGRITPVVLTVDVVAGAVLPFGLISLVLALEGEAGSGEGHEEDEGGSPPDSGGPTPPPPGAPIVDWEQFEAAFRAYAREHAGSLPG